MRVRPGSVVSLAYDSPASRADSTPGGTGVGTAALIGRGSFKRCTSAAARLLQHREDVEPDVRGGEALAFLTEGTLLPEVGRLEGRRQTVEADAEVDQARPAALRRDPHARADADAQRQRQPREAEALAVGAVAAEAVDPQAAADFEALRDAREDQRVEARQADLRRVRLGIAGQHVARAAEVRELDRDVGTDPAPLAVRPVAARIGVIAEGHALDAAAARGLRPAGQP